MVNHSNGKTVSQEFQAIAKTLAELTSDYAKACRSKDVDDPNAPVTERDILVEIHQRLKPLCRKNGYHIHCEIKPAPCVTTLPTELKRLPRIDIVILADKNGNSWLASAKTLQNKYTKGSIEARFSSVPIEFFHTAIEVKIQSNLKDAQKDIDTLLWLRQNNPACHCFFVLLNARGEKEDHARINSYANEKSITIFEYTSKGSIGPPE